MTAVLDKMMDNKRCNVLRKRVEWWKTGPAAVLKVRRTGHYMFPCCSHACFSLIYQQKTGKSPRYYPAEDVKPKKAVHKVVQNVRTIAVVIK